MVERQWRSGLQGLNRNTASHLANDRQVEHLTDEVALIVLKVGHYDLEKIVDVPSNKMAGDDFRHGDDRILELLSPLAGMVLDLDADEYGQAQSDAAAPKHGAISLDIAFALKPLHAAQARRW